MTYFLSKLRDELPDRVPNGARRTLDWRGLGEVKLAVGGETLDFEGIGGGVINTHDDDGLLGQAGGLVKAALVVDDINIGGGEDEDIAGGTRHVDLMNNPELGHGDAHSPPLPQNPQYIKGNGENQEGDGKAERDDRVLALPDPLECQPQAANGII